MTNQQESLLTKIDMEAAYLQSVSNGNSDVSFHVSCIYDLTNALRKIL